MCRNLRLLPYGNGRLVVQNVIAGTVGNLATRLSNELLVVLLARFSFWLQILLLQCVPLVF